MLGGTKGLPTGLLSLKGPKQVYFIYFCLEKLRKLEGKDFKEKTDQQSPGGNRPINQVKESPKGLGPLLNF